MGTAISIKAIKPARLKVDGFRLALLNALRAEGVEHRRTLSQTTASWTGEKPKFESLISLAGGDATVVTGPTGSTEGAQKWQWLDEGTHPHVIRARRARTLRFRQGGFRAKTSVGKFESGAGRAASGPWRFPRSVRHPGTKARGWSALLTKRRRDPFRERIFDAMKEAGSKAF